MANGNRPYTTVQDRRDELSNIFEDSQDWINAANTLEEDPGWGSVYEGLGQFIWGAAESLSLGGLEFSDIAEGAIARKGFEKGDIDQEQLKEKTDRMEKAFTSIGGLLPDSYEGDFGELGTMGQVGYTLGAILGTIPTFIVGGGITSKAITGVSKINSAGTRLMTQKASKEIGDFFTKKLVVKKGEMEGIKALGGREFREIAQEGFDIVSKDSFAQSMRRFGNDVFETTAKGEISQSIKTLTNMKDGDILAGLSSEVFEIITRNNPQNAQQILFGLGSKAFRNSPKVGLIAGAMGYDAILGLTIGTMRGSASSAVSKHYGYDEPESYTNKILADALHEGAILSLIGPVKFIKGGSQQSILTNTKNTLYGMVKNLKPVSTMDKEVLKTNIKFLNTLTKNNINKRISDKSGKGVWNTNGWEESASAEEMREFLNIARKDFLLNAPALWAREFGAEIVYSLPRMAMGTLAMHSAGIFQVVKDHGVENVEMAFGATPEERISNIFTAMFFTRKPHSFYTADRMLGFETDKIRDYASQKGEMLAHTIGGMRAMGINNITALNKFLNKYGGRTENDVIGENQNSVRNYMLESTPEIREIKKIITAQDKLASQVSQYDKTTFDKAATEYMLSTFGEKPGVNAAEKRAYRDDIVKTQAIMRFYRDLSFDGRDLEYNHYTSEQANAIVDKLSKMPFGGEQLNAINPQKQLADWHMGNIKNATIEPINKIKSFVVSVYNAFGETIPETNGVLEAPRVEFNFKGINNHLDVQNAFQTAVKDLEVAKRLRLTKEIVEREEATTLEQRQKASVAYEETVDALHTWLYGVEWRNKQNRDEGIINHTAWYKAYDILNQRRQAEDTIAVLTGDGNHTMEKAEFDKLRQQMFNVLSNKKRVEIEETTDTGLESKEYTELLDFTAKLHTLISRMNPAERTDPSAISYNDAITLKDNFTKQLGDIITRPDAYKFLKKKLVDYSLEKLNLTNVQGDKHNIKSGILGLMESSEFKTDEGITNIPNYTSMRDYLRVHEIEKDQHKDLIDFYKEILDAVDTSKFPLIKINHTLNESKKGEWLDGLKRIKRDSVADFIERSQGRLQEMVEEIEVAGDHFAILAEEMYNIRKRVEKDDALDKKVEALSIQHLQFREIVNMVKAAHQGANRTFLHAMLSKDVSYSELVTAISNAKTSDRASEYFVELLKLHEKINEDAVKNGFTESLVSDAVEREIENASIPDRDVQAETIRISTAQFSLKYGFSSEDIASILFMHRSPTINADRARNVWERLLSQYPNISDQGKANIQKLIDNIGTGELGQKAFKDTILIPLTALTTERRNAQVQLKIKKASTISDNDIKADVDSIVTSGTSSIPITEYQYLGQGRFVAGTKLMAYTRDRGINGVIDKLANGTNGIILLSNTSVDSQGKRVRNFPKYLKDDIAGNLQNIDVDYKIGLRDAVYKHRSIDEAKYGDIMPHGNRNQFQLVEFDESTAVLVRVDHNSPLRDSINRQFRQGGELHSKIMALRTSGQKENPILQDLMTKVNSNNLKENDVANAVRVTRILLDAPHIFYKATAGYTHGAYNMTDSEQLDKLWKYLKTAEPKNGFIGSPENLRRKHDTLKYLADQSETGGHYKHLYEYVKSWITPDANGKYRALKVLSIADEIETFTGNADGRNIFDSRTTAEALFNKHNPNLSKEEIKYNVDLIEKLHKSKVDGEFLMTEDAYVSSLAMMAAANDKMVRFDANGDVETIHAGGIKPSINHISIDHADRTDPNYGRARVFYAKTAFKHRPEFNQLLTTLDVDAITFKSANKINEFKNNRGLDWNNSDIDEHDPNGRNTFASIKPVDINTSEGLTNLVEWMGIPGNLIYDKNASGVPDKSNHISHIPFSSINMFAVAKGKKPMVSANLTVHMRDNNGVREWIDLDQKIRNVDHVFQESHNNMYYTTALARKLLGDSASQGDMQFINTGLDYVMRYDGFITDKWMREAIDDRIIPYLLNNGGIAGGRVDEGTYDVMSGDFSGFGTNNNFLNFSVRKSILQKEDPLGGIFGGPRKVLTFFGDFLPSHEFSNIKYKPFGGEGNRKNIGNVVTFRTEYTAKDAVRVADGFFVKDEKGDPIFIIEGIGIDETGSWRNLNYINIKTDKKFTSLKESTDNKVTFDDALEHLKEVEALYENGDTFGNMQIKLHEWRDAKGFSPETAGIATVNSRQPRNQMGDLIITKLKSFKDSKGDIIVSHDAKSGNLSTMNFIDVIHAQDADFDMDKSMVFGSAPYKFWAEVGRLAGYETAADRTLTSTIFLEEANRGTYSRLWEADNQKETINNLDAARGRFVKMHQTMTYMANMFRGAEGDPIETSKGRDILSFTHLGMDKDNKFVIRVNDINADYVNTSEYVATAVKKFLDMYENQPTNFLENIDRLQWQIYFGPNGLFKVGSYEKGKDKKVKFVEQPGLTINELDGPRDAIVQHFLRPVNKYLRMNRGTSPDETGAEIRATVEDYHFTFRNLLYSFNKDFVKYRGDENWNIDIKKGLDMSYIYFGEGLSSNPYDFAMRSIYNMRGNLAGRGDESQSAVSNIIKYIEYGHDKTGIDTPERDTYINRILQSALSGLVKDDAKALEFEDIVSRISYLDFELANMDKFDRTGAIRENRNYKILQSKRDRAMEIKRQLEEVLAYKFSPDADIHKLKNPAETNEKGFVEKYKFENRYNRPIVVRFKDKISEIIMPGKRNVNPIGKRNVLLLNGKRFELVRGDDSIGLEISNKMFNTSEKWRSVSEDGRVTMVSVLERRKIGKFLQEYNDEVRIEWENRADKSKYSLEEYSMKRMSKLIELFDHEFIKNSVANQEALVAAMLAPAMDQNVITVSPFKGAVSKGVKLGVKLIENKNSKVIYHFLSQVANQTLKDSPMNKTTAEKILKDVTALKKIGHFDMMTKGVNDIKMDSRRSFNHPSDLTFGHIAKDNELGIGVFQALHHKNAAARKAAEIMVEYFSGERLLDSATLYRATKVLEEVAKIPASEIMINTRFETGTGRSYGVSMHTTSSLHTSENRNYGMGGSIKESVPSFVKKAFKCYTK